MTEREKEVIDLAIKWRDSKYAVEEAIVRQDLKLAIDLLKQERRNARQTPNT